MIVISAASLTCNDSTKYACSEAFNSEFKVDLFRSKGELNQKIDSDFERWTSEIFFIVIIFTFLKNVKICTSEYNADPAGKI